MKLVAVLIPALCFGTMRRAAILSATGIASVLLSALLVSRLPADPAAAALTEALIADPADEARLIAFHAGEVQAFGGQKNIDHYNSTPLQETMFMQRSGRRRLFDHNILLRALYAGKVEHKDQGPLGKLFEKAVFIDIGSAILFGEGAPTVRDIYDDALVAGHLSLVVATDIDDPSSEKTRYVTIYRKKNNLPFPVLEIDMRMVYASQFSDLLQKAEPGVPAPSSPVIFRTANSGPDLFYSSVDMRRHLRAAAQSCKDRNVIYLFSKFVLFKPSGLLAYQLIGEIDPSVGIYHSADVWLNINWATRTIQQAFYPNKKYLRIL